MKIKAKVLAVAFVFSTVIGVLSNSYLYLSAIHMELTTDPFVTVLREIVSPLLLFVSFYFIGKRIETAKEFWSYLLSFFLGNASGMTFGSFIIFMLIQTVNPNPVTLLVAKVLGSFLGSLFSYSFFVGFSALAISYIVKKAHTQD